MFLILNTLFTAVELGVGYYQNSLGLYSDGIHMLFDSSVVFANLVLISVSKWPPNEKFNFGYGRVQVLAGFVNGLLLFYASFCIICDAFGRILWPQTIKLNGLMGVAFVGLVVNIIGIFSFDHQHYHYHKHDHSNDKHECHKHDHTSHKHEHSHSNEKSSLLHGMFLHVLADTLGSIAVLFSTFVVQLTGWTIIDPICSIFMSILIMVSVWPLLSDSTLILLNRVPDHLIESIREAKRRISEFGQVQSFLVFENADGECFASCKVDCDLNMFPEVAGLIQSAGISHVNIQINKTTR